MLTSPGASPDTFVAFLAYLDAHTCYLIVYENSDHMADDKSIKGKTNLDCTRLHWQAGSLTARVHPQL